MKNRIRAVWQVGSVAVVGLALAFGQGCKKPESAEGPGPNQAAPLPSGAGIVSAEKTSFKEVTAQLDPGGNFYLYLGTEQWLKGLSEKVGSWKDLVGALPSLGPDERAMVEKAFAVATKVIKDSGVENVSGVGMSSIARESGFYRSKAFLHHYKGAGSGFLWNLLGEKPHALVGLDLLPTNTVFAAFSDLEVSAMWSVIQDEARAAGLPEAEKLLEQLPAGFQAATGISWNQFLGTLGGEFGLVMTFNEAKQVSIPVPGGEPLQVPEPAFMLIMKVNDDTVFDRVDKLITQTGMQVAKADQDGAKLRTVTVPLPLPVPLRPTLASSDGYLFLASSDDLVKEVLAVRSGKSPGLKSTAEFKRLADGTPVEGNQFFFISQRFGQSFLELLRRAQQSIRNEDVRAAAQPSGAPPAQLESARAAARAAGREASSQLWDAQLRSAQPTYLYSVGAATDEGWLVVGNGNQSVAPVLLGSVAIAPAAMFAAIAVPNFVKARETAQNNACLNNLRRIDGAKQQWALENRKSPSATPAAEQLGAYLNASKLPACPKGGTYTINPVGLPPKCNVPGHQLPR